MVRPRVRKQQEQRNDTGEEDDTKVMLELLARVERVVVTEVMEEVRYDTNVRGGCTQMRMPSTIFLKNATYRARR